MLINDLEVSESSHVNEVKYQALAYLVKPYGHRMLDLVEDQWSDWLMIVSQAKWLKRWQNFDEPCSTPKGTLIEKPFNRKAGNVALRLYINAVWGFGVEGWLKRPTVKAVRGREIDCIKKSISENYTRSIYWSSNFYDTSILETTGLLIPIEYGDLDRWLETLWDQII